MKTERSILMLTSLSILTFAIFTCYNTPLADQHSETEYLIDIENYKREVTDKIAVDNRRLAELRARFEIKKSEDRRADEDILEMFRKKIDEMQAALNNCDAIGLEEWELFKKKFDHDLNELHNSLINLIVKTSTTLNDNNSIQSFVNP